MKQKTELKTLKKEAEQSPDLMRQQMMKVRLIQKRLPMTLILEVKILIPVLLMMVYLNQKILTVDIPMKEVEPKRLFHGMCFLFLLRQILLL